MKFLYTSCLTICLFCAGNTMAGGPWVHRVDGGFASLSFSSFRYSGIYDKELGVLGLRREVTDFHVQAHVEWSIIDDLDFIIIVPYKMISSGSEELENPTIGGANFDASALNTFGNSVVGIKYQFRDGPVSLAWQADVLLPTETVDAEKHIRTGYHATGLTPSFHAGLSRDNWYASAQAGLQLRTDKYSIEYFLTTEAGLNWKDRIHVAAVLNLNKSFFNGTRNVNDGTRPTGTYLNDREYLAYGGKVSVSVIDGWALGYAYYGATLAHNVGAAPSHTFSLIYRWEPWEPQYKDAGSATIP